MLHRITTFFCLFLIVLGTSWALIHPNFFRVHDFTQAGRVAEMARAISDGHIVPRWSQNFGSGYGMPLFEFYAPLPYYIGALLLLLGLPMILVLKALFVIANIGTAVGSYKAGKELFGTTYGWIVAALVTLAPYRAVNLYIRGAIGEAWGSLMIPWILYGVILIFNKKRHGFLVTCISLIGLFLSHNLTTLLAVVSLCSFAILGISLTYLELHKQKKTVTVNQLKQHVLEPLLLYVGSGVLAIGCAAFYLFPALLEKDFTKVRETVITEYFDYHIHFLYLRQFLLNRWGYGGSSWGVEDGISFYVGTIQIVLLFCSTIFILSLIINWIKIKKISIYDKKIAVIFILSAALTAVHIFMTTARTQAIWDAVETLHFVQFPWRWNNILISWIGLTGGLAILLIKTKVTRVFLALLVVILCVATNFSFFKPEKYLELFEQYYYADESRIASELSETLFDYMPAQVPTDISPPTSLVTCLNQQLLTQITCEQITIISNKTQSKEVQTNFTQPVVVQFSIADYPGWKISTDDSVIQHKTSTDGLILLTVPTGEHTIKAVFGATPIRAVSDAISFTSFLLLGYSVVNYFRSKKYNT